MADINLLQKNDLVIPESLEQLEMYGVNTSGGAPTDGKFKASDIIPKIKGNTPATLIQTPDIDWTGTQQEYARIWDAVNAQSLQAIPNGNTIFYRTRRIVYTNLSASSYTMYVNLWLETKKYVPSTVGGITPSITLGNGGNITLNSTTSLLTRIESQVTTVVDGVVENGIVADLGTVSNGIADAVDSSGNVYNVVLENIVFQDDNNDQWIYNGDKEVIGVGVTTSTKDYTFLSQASISQFTNFGEPFNKTRLLTLSDPNDLVELNNLVGMRYGDSVVISNYQNTKAIFVYNGTSWDGPITGAQGPQGPAGQDGQDGVNGIDGQDGQDGNVLNGERYATLAEVNALTTKSVTVQYIVDSDGDNNGYYTWDGTSATVDLNRPLNPSISVIDKDNVNDSVNGKAVFDFNSQIEKFNNQEVTPVNPIHISSLTNDLISQDNTQSVWNGFVTDFKRLSFIYNDVPVWIPFSKNNAIINCLGIGSANGTNYTTQGVKFDTSVDPFTFTTFQNSAYPSPVLGDLIDLEIREDRVVVNYNNVYQFAYLKADLIASGAVGDDYKVGLFTHSWNSANNPPFVLGQIQVKNLQFLETPNDDEEINEIDNGNYLSYSPWSYKNNKLFCLEPAVNRYNSLQTDYQEMEFTYIGVRQFIAFGNQLKKIYTVVIGTSATGNVFEWLNLPQSNGNILRISTTQTAPAIGQTVRIKISELKIEVFYDGVFSFELLKTDLNNSNVRSLVYKLGFVCYSQTSSTLGFRQKGEQVTNLRFFGSKKLGKNIGVLGDSISAGSGVNPLEIYHKLLATFDGCVVTVNAIPGTTITDGGTGVEFTDPTRWQSLDAVNYLSDVLIFGGVNDWLQGLVTGDISKTESDTNYFYGALKFLYASILDRNPLAKIHHITPCHTQFNQNGSFPATIPEFNSNTSLYLNDYINAIKEVAALYGVNVIDAYNESIITAYNIDELSTDLIHFGTEGHRSIYELVKKYL